MDKNEHSASLLPADPDTRIQLVVNRSEEGDDTIDLGRVFHNMKLKTRVFAWVLVLCLVVGICAPLLLYQITNKPLTVTSVVTLRYDVPASKKGLLVTPDGNPLDLTTVTSAPVLQKALDGLTLSKPVTVENLRNNMKVTRVLTNESSRTREALAGLADAKNVEVYRRLEDTELTYQNRFIVSLTNSFGDADSNVRYDLTAEELCIVLNRILDAYNETLIRQYANVRLPEDRVSLIDTEEMDIPEILDALNDALESLLSYCAGQPAAARAYRSWQTGLSLNDWMNSIRTVQSVNVDYVEAYVYSEGLMRNKDSLSLTYRYHMRQLQNNLDKVKENIADTETLLKDYKNNNVLVSMQEADSTRSTKVTTAYYNNLVLQQQSYYEQASSLQTKINEYQNKLNRLETSKSAEELGNIEEELAVTMTSVQSLQNGVRTHMIELFDSPLYTTYSEHSVPQGKEENFLKASAKRIVIGAAAGLVIGCGLWFLAGLAPEFRRDHDDAPKAKAKKAAGEVGKEAAKA